jgi:nucleotide-binding universal stress UspA family protein
MKGTVMEKILVATDSSPASREAVSFALELAKEHDSKVYFVHVVPELHVVPTNGFGMVGALPRDVTNEDRRSLDDAEAGAEDEGVWARTAVLRGNVVDEIVSYADNLAVDLIVVGSRGHGAVANALLGSVSRGLLSESKRPVAIVRGTAIGSEALAAASQ